MEFKNLNRDIIKRATKEINEKTDLYIEFAFKKIGRSISDIKIYIKLKKDTNIIKEKIEDDLHIKYFTLLQNTFLLSPNQAEKVIDKYQDVNNLDKILE
ncbi:replication initiation protein [bacterium]|nr:replication initiation protein [bacterium]